MYLIPQILQHKTTVAEGSNAFRSSLDIERVAALATSVRSKKTRGMHVAMRQRRGWDSGTRIIVVHSLSYYWHILSKLGCYGNSVGGSPSSIGS